MKIRIQNLNRIAHTKLSWHITVDQAMDVPDTRIINSLHLLQMFVTEPVLHRVTNARNILVLEGPPLDFQW